MWGDLQDVVARFMPLWNDTLVPAIKQNKKILIAAHGNTLRALVKHLDNIPEVSSPSSLTHLPACLPHSFTASLADWACLRSPPLLTDSLD